MQTYIEETLAFIKSTEMREYLREHTDKLDGHDYAKIVAYAPAPIERKIPVLDLIAEQSGYTGHYNNPAKMAAAARAALAERYDNPPGTIFWLRLWHYHKETSYNGDVFFTEYDAAVRYIKEQQALLNDADAPNYLSHSIEKHIPGENGAMKEYCEWVLNHSGEAWYFDYGHGGKFEPDGWIDLWDYLGSSQLLPVPFAPGDIILADCRPFAKERRVLITDIGDNHDSSAVQCLYCLPEGKLSMASFKHNAFLDFTDESSHISALYRAERWNGELSADEAPLQIVGAALKKNPGLGDELQDFILRSELKASDRWGVSWEDLKNAINL